MIGRLYEAGQMGWPRPIPMTVAMRTEGSEGTMLEEPTNAATEVSWGHENYELKQPSKVTVI